MSSKMTCPACNSRTSSVWTAVVIDDSACPYCGMSAEMIREVSRYRAKGADEELVRKLATLGQLASNLYRENQQLRQAMIGIQAEVGVLDRISQTEMTEGLT